MASDLWAARPDLRPWCAKLSEQAARWQPDASLAVNRDRVVETIVQAAALAAPWLVHPGMNRLTLPETGYHVERDQCLVACVAAHSDSSTGTDPGIDDGSIAVDPYCVSTGFPLSGSCSMPLAPAEASLLDATVRETHYALDLLARRLPACAGWAASMVRVIVPIRAETAAAWSSGSQPEIPGLIQLTGLTGPALALEGLVHEAAHHHFTMLEASGPFVDPEHRGFYQSPLRSDPRPLRKVLLAVHALQHIVAFYDDGLACGLLSAEWEPRRVQLIQRLSAGLTTVERGRSHFTRQGEDLVASLM